MIRHFDISKVDLSEQRALVFCDKKGILYLDTNEGMLAALTRWVTRLIGVRDYRLDKIIKSLETRVDTETGLARKNFTLLCRKMAKGCGINEETFAKILGAENLLGHKKVSRTDKSTIEQFFIDLSKNRKLQKKIGKFQARHLKGSTQESKLAEVLERAQMTSRWAELGLDIKMLNRDYEGAVFLIKSRLIYSIVGFQNSTSDGPIKHKIKIDRSGHITILKEGAYVPVRKLEKEFFFDKAWQELARKEAPDEHWNYLSPDGLVPVDRWLSPEFIPVETLSEEEMKTLVAHAQSFYPEGKAPASDTPRDCVVQIFTNPRKAITGADTAVLTRLDASFPVHVAIRIITNDGLVYSTGFGSTIDEDKFTEKAMLATINGMPTILDYEEFRKHEGRIVTSIPVTSEATYEILETLQDYRSKTIRFNLAEQNCARLATDVLDKTGVKVNNVVNGSEFLAGVFPSTKQAPVAKKVIRVYSNQTKKLKSRLPKIAQDVLTAGDALRVFIPRKMASVFCNVLVLALGGSSGSPLPQDRDQAAQMLDKTEGLQEFKTILTHPLDIFRKDARLSHSLPIIQWQLQQRSTVVHPYKNPCMCILPSAEEEALTQYFKKKYLTNFGLE